VLEIPEDTAATLNFMPEDLPEQFRIAAAIKWYELGRVSQGRAAEIAGLSRSAFIELLVEYGVSPFQESATDLRQIP
jgi:predicted HTH domain antitoxin